ncbi:CLOCK-interacting pacemaker [Scleropages formosus]|uniref:Si:ch211-132b12.7 n=1 Tax=Scleropages formosus TaxID=113540 RepID=A0A8C9VA42_SCLFO|nr:CLOCK-interacting pacemaker-like [Scleropages formosus]
MPKEQVCLGERAPRGASKNAKDKSNSATLLASRDRASGDDGSSRQGSCCSSEKDSGYSDTGSDSLQTDVEDQRSGARKHWGGAWSPGRVGEVGGQAAARHSSNAPVSAAAEFRELTPIYILKNVLLKQPLTVPPGPEQLLHSQLAWGGRGLGAQTPTQLVFIQQPGIPAPAPAPAPLHIVKPPAAKAGGGSNKNKGSYLPILNSYPRIAPHPSKKTPEQDKGGAKGSGSESHSLSKRMCTEERREAVSSTLQLVKQPQHSQQESKPRNHSTSHCHSRSLGGADSTSSSHTQKQPPLSQPCPRRSQQPPRGSSRSYPLSSPSVSSSETTLSSVSPPSPEAPPRPTPRPSCKQSTARQRRFLNTMEILSQSGLLDITMRTQELLRQSAATERDITQLQQHAQLLCQAAQGGPDATTACEKLYQAMLVSGRYPDLSQLGIGCSSSETDQACPAPVEEKGVDRKNDAVVTVIHKNHNEEAYPPSPLLASTPDPADYSGEVQGSPSHPSIVSLSTDHMASSKSPLDAAMPPDSSTHSGLQ